MRNGTEPARLRHGDGSSTREGLVFDLECLMDLNLRDVSRTYPNGVQSQKHVTLTIPAGLPS